MPIWNGGSASGTPQWSAGAVAHVGSGLTISATSGGTLINTASGGGLIAGGGLVISGGIISAQPSMGYTRPAGSSFTLLNAAGSTLTDNVGGSLDLLVPSKSGTWNVVAVEPIPGGPTWTVTCKIGWQATPTYYYNANMVLMPSNNPANALITFGRNATGTTNGVCNWSVQRYNNYASYNTGFAAGNGYADTWVWQRLYYDGTNMNYQFSIDGLVWTTLYSEAYAAFFTPAYVGFGCGNNLSAGSTPQQLLKVAAFF
jgi:hypothetical protein